MGDESYSESYTYNSDGTLNQIVGSDGRTVTMSYDGLQRLSGKTIKQGDTTVVSYTYSYRDVSETATTTQIASVQVTAGNSATTYAYTYDSNGNILSVSDGTNTTSYVYDSMNQLVRENNQAANKTWTWVYDNAGNIQSKSEYAYTTGALGEAVDTVSYGYTDENWSDLLTSYDGNTITYDEIGNPLSDGTWSYTWENGRQLASMTDGTTTWNFTYDANGMRTSRTNGTTTYNYVYNGSQLVQISVGNDVLYFTSDTVTYNGTTYYYITNLQGDITHIVDNTGTAVVTYAYDAWGNILSTSGELVNTLGVLNPLRYRGYVYDPESDLYYLQSRYYDPEIGRFINGDNPANLGVKGLLSYNLFTYCGNNPVMGYDPYGCWDFWGVATGLTLIAVGVAAFIVCPITVPGMIATAIVMTTGVTTTYAAATDSALVIDLSYSSQITPDTYGKVGASIILDYGRDGVYLYPHMGAGKGFSSGLSYAPGMVKNFEDPEDYAEWFIDVNGGYNLGVDHCWDPRVKHDEATQATAVSVGSGTSFGIGVDWYFRPIILQEGV